MSDEQKIKCYKTPSGTRKCDKRYLEQMYSSLQRNKEQPRENFIYTRSSKKQMDDLSRQIKYVQSRNSEYATYRTLSDIGSGINFTRKGLQTILDTCLQGTIGEVVVAHRDRLSRFGFDLIKCFIANAGGKLTVLDDDGNKSTEQELAEDRIYRCKQMGKRSYKTKKPKNSIETKSNAEENIERMD